MERLTKNINGMVWFASQDTELWLEPYEMSTHDIRTAIKKLAAYEDTGLLPEAIDLLRLSMIGTVAAEIADEQGCVELSRAKQIAHAEAEGRLVILPCKLGDTVWVLHTGINTNFLHVFEGRCVEISQSLSCGAMLESYTINLLAFNVVFYGHDIGSTMFFSRSEAEAALKKRKEEKHGTTD